MLDCCGKNTHVWDNSPSTYAYTAFSLFSDYQLNHHQARLHHCWWIQISHRTTVPGTTNLCTICFIEANKTLIQAQIITCIFQDNCDCYNWFRRTQRFYFDQYWSIADPHNHPECADPTNLITAMSSKRKLRVSSPVFPRLFPTRMRNIWTPFFSENRSAWLVTHVHTYALRCFWPSPSVWSVSSLESSPLK